VARAWGRKWEDEAEGRNPKAETRKKAEARNPKATVAGLRAEPSEAKESGCRLCI
jgi:hypothetical protein